MTGDVVWACTFAFTLWQAAGRIPAQFDTTKLITVNGIVHGITQQSKNPHVFIAVAVQVGPGDREVRWVLRGDTRDALERAGWTFGPGGTLMPGVVISASGYTIKTNTDPSELLAGLPPWMLQAAKAAALVHGIEIIRLDVGKKLYFGPGK